ncbi:MAG: hypothetical protein RIQ60_192 [Pseudomonadota bacterium]|jgi:hypothetical protein
MSLLRPPVIDFADNRPRQIGGWLLAAAGVALLALAGLQAQESQSLLSAQRDGLRTLQAQSPAARALASLSPEERRRRQQMEVVANYLAAPWEGLLSAFESRAKGKVVVRKLEPDAATGMVRMVGETQSLKSMMDYVQALESDRRLHEVVLLKHERSQELNLAPGANAAPGLPGAPQLEAGARPGRAGLSGKAAPVAESPAPIEFTVVAAWRIEARAALAGGGAAANGSADGSGGGNATPRNPTTVGAVQ